ncbi:MAG: lysophospholipid acyltransferase family protein [Acidobacteriota bacterium]
MGPGTRLKIWLSDHVAPHVLRWVTRSLKLEVEGRDRYLAMRQAGKGCILAFWHESFFMLPQIHTGENVHVMVSKSADGEMIHRVLVRFGNATVRGSSSSGGKEALQGLIEKSKDGFCLAITPDGPRGPRRQLQPGLIALAQRTGLPIVLMACGARRRWVTRSWDRFWIPKPWSEARVIYSDPIPVPAGLTDEAFETMRLSVERELTELADRMSYDARGT